MKQSSRVLTKEIVVGRKWSYLIGKDGDTLGEPHPRIWRLDSDGDHVITFMILALKTRKADTISNY